MPSAVAPANISIQAEAVKPRSKAAAPKPAKQDAPAADAAKPEGSFEDALARAKKSDDPPSAQAESAQKKEEPKQTTRTTRGKKTESKKGAKGKSQPTEENPDGSAAAQTEQKPDAPVDAEQAVSISVQGDELAVVDDERPLAEEAPADPAMQPSPLANQAAGPQLATAQPALAATAQVAATTPQPAEQPQSIAAPEPPPLQREAKPAARPRVSELRPRPDASPVPAARDEQLAAKPEPTGKPQVENAPAHQKATPPQAKPVAQQSNAQLAAQPQVRDDATVPPPDLQVAAAPANKPATQAVQPPAQQPASQPSVSIPAAQPQPTLDQPLPSHWSELQIASAQQPQLVDPQSPDSPAIDATTAFQAMLEALTAPDPDAKSAPKSDSLDPQSTLASAPQPPSHPQTEAASAKPPQPQPAPREPQFAEVNHPRIVTGIRSELMPHGGTMQLRLDPPELGALQVRIEMRDGVMTAAFQTSNDDAARMLSHSLGQLKHALESQGVSVEKLQVERTPREQSNNSTRDDSQQQHQPDQQSQQEQQRRELLRRMWRRLSGGADPLDVTA